jgi:hypothetical protein
MATEAEREDLNRRIDAMLSSDPLGVRLRLEERGRIEQRLQLRRIRR